MADDRRTPSQDRRLQMSGSEDLIDYFKLNVRFDTTDAHTTVETIEKSDRARGLRQVREEKIWRQHECIGRGSFGSVWVEYNQGNPPECRAVKEIPKREGMLDYTRELAALGKLSKHQNIFVDFHGWYENERSVYLAMEYFEHGDLGGYINQGLEERDAQVIGKQLLEGLAILHTQNWAHRDLKPQNIFVVSASPNWWVKIGDFGISKRLLDNETSTSIGTHPYMAPETLSLLLFESGADVDSESEGEEHKYKTSVAVDIWSLGCVLYQILTKALPFPKARDLERFCRQRRPFPEDGLRARKVGQEGCEFVQKLLRPQPSERLTANAALQERWITAADDNNKAIGVKRAQSTKTNPQLEPLAATRASQNSASPLSTSEITVKAPIAPARSSVHDTTASVTSLRLDERSGFDRRERTSPRQSSSLNGGTHQRSKSPSSQPIAAISSPKRNGRLEFNHTIGVALWNFVKQDPNDLSLKQYEFVQNIRKASGSWWHGTNKRGEKGFFPSNYIGQTRLQAEVLFDFIASVPGDIELKKGERITDISIFSEGWWIGTNSGGKRGKFPGNYVELDQDAIKEELDHERRVSNGQARPAASPPGPNPRHDSTGNAQSPERAPTRWTVGRALRYYAADDGTISFEPGELITNIQELSDPKFLVGTSSSHERGEFPRSSVSVYAERASGPPGSSDEDRWLAQSRMPSPHAPRTGKKMLAREAHRPSSPGELAFDVGDELVDIECSTLTWWFGWHRRNGTRGVFPSDKVYLPMDNQEHLGDGDDDWTRLEKW